MKVELKNSDMTNFRKSNHFCYQLSIIDLDKKREVLVARFYGTARRMYCCVWYSEEKGGSFQTGNAAHFATGYGWCKRSAALEYALVKLGFVEAEGEIAGRGDKAIDDFMHRIANHAGIENYLIHRAHA